MTERRTITFFSEDRLSTNERGQVTSPDPDLARGGWARGLPHLTSARFAARLDSRSTSGGYAVTGSVLPLPYYQGGAGLARNSPALVRAVWQAVRSSTVVAVRLPGVVGLLAVLSATLLRRKVVIELVGDVQEVLRSGVVGRLGAVLASLFGAVTRWAVRRGSVVRYVTTSRLQEGYPAGASAIVVAFSDVQLDAEDFETSTITPDVSPRIIAIGSQEQMYKGHDLLIAALDRLRRAGHDASLVLLGQGRFQAQLRAQATRLGVAEHVHFTGHVSPRSAVRDELDRAWVYAMPSRTEGLPRALVEAMARAKPCVVSDVGGMPELVDPAFVIDRDDVAELTLALERLISNPRLRKVEGDRNREAATQLWHQREDDLRRWLSVLNDVVGNAT